MVTPNNEEKGAELILPQFLHSHFETACNDLERAAYHGVKEGCDSENQQHPLGSLCPGLTQNYISGA